MTKKLIGDIEKAIRYIIWELMGECWMELWNIYLEFFCEHMVHKGYTLDEIKKALVADRKGKFSNYWIWDLPTLRHN